MDTKTLQDDPGRGRDRDMIEDARAQFGSVDQRAPDVPANRPELLPERVGPYRVIHSLGRGGMGSVLLAMREEDQFRKRVAIKLIKKGMDTREILRRFDLERQVLGALNHPNIARLLDAGESEDGRPYFVLEYVEGLPIDEYCDANNLPIVERVQIFRKVCSAIHYAHQNLIVHRDLKPGNILVTKEGEPKLLDFGIAKLLNPDLFNVTLATGPEVRLMTPEYASPEQVQGQPISTASDVYSLGILLYELLTGHRPYQIKTQLQNEIVRIICEVEPEKPSTAISRSEDVRTRDGTFRRVNPEDVARKRDGQLDKLKKRLRGDLDNILLKALQKPPRRRYVSAEQFSEDLQRFLDGLPVTAQPDTWIYRAGKFVRRNRVGVTTAVTVFCLLIAGIIGTTWQWRRTMIAESVASRRSEQFEKLIDSFLERLKGGLQRTEGSVVARKALAETAMAAVEDFAKQGGDDPRVRLKLAKAYQILGDVYGGIRSGSEGNKPAAAAEYQKAFDICSSLYAKVPEDAEVSFALATTHLRLADVSSGTDAIDHARQAVKISRALVERSPRDAAIARFLAIALVKYADGLPRDDPSDEAQNCLQESMKIRKLLLADSPMDVILRRDLTVGVSRLGDWYFGARRYQEATPYFKEALELREALLKENPDARSKRDVAVTREKLGNTLLKLGKMDAAKSELSAALTILKQLSTADPKDARVRNDADRVQLRLNDVSAPEGSATVMPSASPGSP